MNGLRLGVNCLFSTFFRRRVALVERRGLQFYEHSTANIRPQLRLSCWHRSLHTTPPSQAHWFLLTPLARFFVAVGARTARWWWKRQPNEWRKSVWAGISARKRHIVRGLGVVSLGGVVYYWVHLEKTPITHRRRFVMFTREQVESLIEAEKDMINKMISGKGTELPATHIMYQKVASVASQIITKNMGAELEGFKWTLHVVDDPNMVDAVCLPSGEIFVFTGLVYACHNIDELALILSHEIAHAVLGHGLEVLSSRAVVDFFSLFVVGLIWSVMPFGIMASVLLHILSRRTADVLIHFPHSRKLEIEADSVGLIMAARACYDPIVAIKVWEHLPGSLTSVSTRTPEWNAGDKAPQGGFSGDKAPQGGFSGDKAPQGGFSGDKAPQGGFSGDKAPQGGYSGDKAPQGGFSGDKAPQGGISGDKAPQGGFSGDKAPQGGLSGDKAPQGGFSGDKAPQGGFSGDKAPQGGFSGDKAPQGGFSGDKATQGGSSGDEAPPGGSSIDEAMFKYLSVHPSNTQRYENLVLLLPEAELVYQNSNCTVEFTNIFS